jgi:hypothetical protein
MAPVRNHPRKAGCCLATLLTVLFAACGGGGNVNYPRGNAIGERHTDFMRVVARAKTLSVGRHDRSTLPADMWIKNLKAVYVDKRKAYALEFPSEPIDCNPIFVFVEEGVPDPEAVVRAMCADHGNWRFSRRLDEPGWYFVTD